MFENVNKEGGQVAAEAEAAEAAEGLLAQRVAAFEGGGESPIANRSSRMDGWRDLWALSSDTNSSTVCRLLFYILTSANRIPDPAPIVPKEHWRRCTKSAVELSMSPVQ